MILLEPALCMFLGWRRRDDSQSTICILERGWGWGDSPDRGKVSKNAVVLGKSVTANFWRSSTRNLGVFFTMGLVQFSGPRRVTETWSTTPGCWEHFCDFLRKNSQTQILPHCCFSQDPPNSLNLIYRIGPDATSFGYCQKFLGVVRAPFHTTLRMAIRP